MSGKSSHIRFFGSFPKIWLVFIVVSVLLLYTLVVQVHRSMRVTTANIPSYPVFWSSISRATSGHILRPVGLCSNSIVILVGSHPDHSEVRQVLRRTWSGPIRNQKLKLIFVFGQLVEGDQSKLAIEHKQHGDLLQGRFVDSYHNVTIRDIMGFKWVVDHCRKIKFIIRADDDIAVDLNALIDHLLRMALPGDYVGCFNIVRQAKVQRWDRYAISQKDYPYDTYDDYCQGWLYVVTPSAVRKWLAVAPKSRPFWINDVFISGTLSRMANISLSHIPLRFTDYYYEMVQLAQSSQLTPDYYYQLGPTKAEAKLTDTLQTLYSKVVAH